MTHYRVIVNPVSGRGEGQRSLPDIEAKFKQHNLSYSIRVTDRPWDAADLAFQAAQESCDIVVSVGGDGTVNEVVNGLMRARQAGLSLPALGVLTVGRGNDFAAGVGIPSDLEKAFQILVADFRRPLDIGYVVGGDYPQGRYFANGIGIGFDAVVGFVALKLKWLHGFPSYLVAALETIFLYYKAPRVQISFDEQKLELDSLMVSVMNGRRMGGGFYMAPDCQTDDGLFDICIAHHVSKLKIFALIPRFMAGTQSTHPAIQTLRTSVLTVTALEGSLPAHADGETLCTAGHQLELKLLPSQLEVIRSPQESTP